MSDAAVRKSTGKIWSEWFRILDRIGAKKMPHIEIARLLYEKYFRPNAPKRAHGLNVATAGGWWSQMVTVEYERARGLRDVNQSTTGYSVSVHKTFPIPVTRLWNAWRMVARKHGFAENTVRKNKIIRYKAEKGKPRFIAAFASKGRRSSRMAVEVVRLSSKKDVEKMRLHWKKELERIPT